MARDPKTYARRYAKALLEVEVEMKGETGPVETERQLTVLSQAIQGEAGRFFTNPVFGLEEKKAVLQDILKKNSISDDLGRFIDVLITERDISLLPEILSEFIDANRERKNEIAAKVRTAFPLEKSDVDRIGSALSKITGKQVFLEVSIDPTLIGGAVAEAGGVVYDASIKNYLIRLKEEYGR